MQRIEPAALGTVFVCTHGGAKHGVSGCRRTYLSNRDLQAHIQYRHQRDHHQSSQQQPTQQLIGGQQPVVSMQTGQQLMGTSGQPPTQQRPDYPTHSIASGMTGVNIAGGGMVIPNQAPPMATPVTGNHPGTGGYPSLQQSFGSPSAPQHGVIPTSQPQGVVGGGYHHQGGAPPPQNIAHPPPNIESYQTGGQAGRGPTGGLPPQGGGPGNLIPIMLQDEGGGGGGGSGAGGFNTGVPPPGFNMQQMPPRHQPQRNNFPPVSFSQPPPTIRGGGGAGHMSQQPPPPSIRGGGGGGHLSRPPPQQPGRFGPPPPGQNSPMFVQSGPPRTGGPPRGPWPGVGRPPHRAPNQRGPPGGPPPRY